jgi:hypothetical protein
MVTETDTNRPYAPPSNLVVLLGRLRSRNLPDRIDGEYLRDIGISDGTISRALFAIRFLGLTAEGGEPTPALRTINSATDEEYRATLAGLVREAYGDVFNSIDPGEDSQDRILNFFRRYTPASQRSRMVIFFLGMCREAGIPTVDAPRQRGMAEPRAPRGANHPTAKSARSVETTRHLQPRRSSINPALEGLIAALPPEGTALSEHRRKQWLQMADATLTFIYGEAGEATEEPENGGEA